MTVVAAALSAQGPLSPAFRVRVLIPSRDLARHGVELHPLPLLPTCEAELRFRAGSPPVRARMLASSRRGLRKRLAETRYDVALVQRQVDLLPGTSLERAATDGRRLVVDVDDAIWLDTTSAARGSRFAVLKDSQRKVRWMARRADAVVAGNEYLAEWLGRYSSRVSIVPSLVEHREVVPRTHAAGGEIVLGWIGSPTTAPQLQGIRGALERVADAAGDLRFSLVVLGGECPPIRGIDVQVRPWSVQEERELLARMDVGLMPLEDAPWTRGKCAYKALQYMAAAVPVVADDVGVSARVVGDGEAGLIPRDAAQWTEAIATLARDPALRQRLGDAGRERVAKEYSVQRWGGPLAAIIRGDDGGGR